MLGARRVELDVFLRKPRVEDEARAGAPVLAEIVAEREIEHVGAVEASGKALGADAAQRARQRVRDEAAETPRQRAADEHLEPHARAEAAREDLIEHFFLFL